MLSSNTQDGGATPEHLDIVFKALGDQTRRKILARLSEGPAMVTQLAKPFRMSLPAVGKHLGVLERAGLVKRTISGRVHRCELNALPLKSAGDWLNQYQVFWDETLHGLSRYFQGDANDE